MVAGKKASRNPSGRIASTATNINIDEDIKYHN
jgi:hypothetical protein